MKQILRKLLWMHCGERLLRLRLGCGGKRAMQIPLSIPPSVGGSWSRDLGRRSRSRGLRGEAGRSRKGTRRKTSKRSFFAYHRTMGILNQERVTCEGLLYPPERAVAQMRDRGLPHPLCLCTLCRGWVKRREECDRGPNGDSSE